MRSRPYLSENLFDIPVDEGTRGMILPVGKRGGQRSVAFPQMALDAYQSLLTPYKAYSGELGMPSVDNPAFTDAATQFAVDFGLLPALGTAAIAKQSPNVLRSGAGGLLDYEDIDLRKSNLPQLSIPLTKKNYEKADEVSKLLIDKILEKNPDIELGFNRSGSAAGPSNYLTVLTPDGKISEIRMSDHGTGTHRLKDYFDQLPLSVPPSEKTFGKISLESFNKRVDEILNLIPPSDKGGLLNDVPDVMTKETDPMVVLHNINEVPVIKAAERGGIPVPSMAISRADEPLTKFGEISLIGDPSMAKPSAKNPVYKTDAYTVRQPRTEVNPNKAAIDFVSKNYTDPIKGIAYSDPVDIAEGILKGDIDTAEGRIATKAAFLSERGKLPPLETFKDEYEFNKFVRQATDKEYGFGNWVLEQAEKMKAAGGSGEERMFMGFTPSGNRRYKSASLFNLVKEMKNKGAGSEGVGGTPNSFRGKLAEKFSTEKQIDKSRGLLGTSDSYEEQAAEVAGQYYEILSAIGSRTGLGHDGAEDVLEYMILGGNKELRDFAKEYTDDFDGVLFGDAEFLAKRMRELPTEYFEIKPNRSVALGEFKGAIVPSNADPITIQALQESGLTNIKLYDTQEERAKLVMEFGDEFFTAPAVPLPATSLLGEDKPAMSPEQMYQAGII